MTQIIVLLWLCLAGGGWGWQSPAIALLHLVIFCALAVVALKRVINTPALLCLPLGWSLATIVVMLELSTVITEAWQYGPLRVMLWTAYLALFYLLRPVNPAPWHRAALISLLIYTPPALILQFDNANITASNVLALALLASPSVKNRFYLWPAVFLVMVYQQCMAGMLAAVVALMVFYPVTIGPALAAVVPLMWADWHFSYYSFALRWQFWKDALSVGPWGVGPGNYFLLNGWPHAHNTALNFVAEAGIMGVIGLFVAALPTVVTYRRITDVTIRRITDVTIQGSTPRWAIATLAGFAVWCLLDDPWQVLAPAFVMVFALANVHQMEVAEIED